VTYLNGASYSSPLPKEYVHNQEELKFTGD
jgi:hypothetical protein